MKKSEIAYLRRHVEKERLNRIRINELLTNPLVQEFIEATKIKYQSLSEDDIYEIICMVLENYKLTGTNKIYVCTAACEVDCRICYEETDYYTRDLKIDDPSAEYKIYVNIESLDYVKAYLEKGEGMYRNSFVISEFEKENIVLNPYNIRTNQNGLGEVRELFLTTALQSGQVKAKKLVLSKYPRL